MITFPYEAKELYFRKLLFFLKNNIEKSEERIDEAVFINLYQTVAAQFGIPTFELEERGCFYDSFYDPMRRRLKG